MHSSFNPEAGVKASFLRPIPVQDRWCVHSYYTVSPYAPDGSGRLLIAGGDLAGGTGEALVLDAERRVIDRFGRTPLHSGFYHTGLWQTWSPDGQYVYYQSGSLERPRIVRRHLRSGEELAIDGDMEGAPPLGEPLISGLMGMLYAAGYGYGRFQPALAPVPFLHRREHGLFRYAFEPKQAALALSVADVLDRHPERARILESERELQRRLGFEEGLTLMCYCVRWSPGGGRLLFYFGNHCVNSGRGEPRLAYIFTADRELRDVRLAIDLSYERSGVHWSWHPDGERLVGYGPDPADPTRMCLAEVRYDGSGYRKISEHHSGGHPSVSPADRNLLVTDESGIPGTVLFIDVRTGGVIRRLSLPRVFGDTEPRGRNRYRVCHHPVFSPDGRKLLVNTLPGDLAAVCEVDVAEALA
ncbi:hypothetical protein [Cohnella hashimotonis]|uniref:Translocation protein TolB n=1 Tax=Cohnella hashimotonis TaxID=2826895 RepID=A0ABT6TN98_9BACL|nr:hypothetical protein [Cohnella hashimotonis]MDI4647785.1 hypothetical protein [Cohnella hashimotonis]